MVGHKKGKTQTQNSERKNGRSRQMWRLGGCDQAAPATLRGRQLHTWEGEAGDGPK